MLQRKLPFALLALLLASSAGCLNLGQRDGSEPLDTLALPVTPAVDLPVEGLDVDIPMDDGVTIRATRFVPDATGASATFPGVVIIHGWGSDRQGGPYPPGMGGRGGNIPLAHDLATRGFVTLAYDVRGFGQSGGVTQLAGGREIRDLRLILDWMENNTPVEKGNFGVTGFSYGGGHSYVIGLQDSRVRAVAPWYGWVDLADGLVPDRVPKQWWATFLLGYGIYSAQGEYDPQLYDWYARAATRGDLQPVIDALRARSVARAIENYTIPILMIEGLGETLFPQTWEAYKLVKSPKRLYTYDGAHGSFDPQAWNLTERWFRHHLRGETADLLDEPPVQVYAPWTGSLAPYAAYPPPGLVEAPRFATADGKLALAPDTGEARLAFVNTLASGRADDPSAASDVARRYGWDGASPLPLEARAAPAGEVVRFRTDAFSVPTLLFGAPTLRANFTSTTSDLQIAARLYDVAPDGTARLLSRGGMDLSPVTPGEVASATLALTRNHWRIEPGHTLVLELAASDLTYTHPLPRPFTGEVLLAPDAPLTITLPLLPHDA